MSSPANPNNLNVGMRCVKYMLFVINLMFALTAVLLITIGTTISSIFGTFEIFVDDHFLSPPALLVAIGSILLIVAVFGCIGALKESTAWINVYGALLAIVFILEVAAAISAFVLQSQVSAMLERTMWQALERFEDKQYVRYSVNYMQESLYCCGVHQPEDWHQFLSSNVQTTTDLFDENFGNETGSGFPDTNFILPDSCCADYINPTYEICERYHTIGCFDRMRFIIAQSAMLIATGATAVAFVQLLGVICAFMLAKTIRRTKSLRAARRYQMQQSLVGPLSEKTHYNQPQYTQVANEEKRNEPVIYVPPTSPSIA